MTEENKVVNDNEETVDISDDEIAVLANKEIRKRDNEIIELKKELAKLKLYSDAEENQESDELSIEQYKKIATITFTPKTFFKFSICLYKLLSPFSKYSILSFFIFSLSIPPWYFIAFIVATHTTASGLILAFLHFISKNFSAPKSAPNPASVIT